MTKKELNELRGEKITLPITKTNGTEQAIKKAIEGGWKGEGAKFNYYEPYFQDIGWYDKNGMADNCYRHEALLDPLFWQALGKAEGWKEGYHDWANYEGQDRTEAEFHCLEFITHIFNGGNIDDFFNNLLK